MEKHPAGRPPENRSHDVTDLPPTLPDLGITKMQSHRWQQEAKVPVISNGGTPKAQAAHGPGGSPETEPRR